MLRCCAMTSLRTNTGVDSEQFDEGLLGSVRPCRPMSSQMAILGWLHRGWVGGIVGAFFLLPGLLCVVLVSFGAKVNQCRVRRPANPAGHRRHHLVVCGSWSANATLLADQDGDLVMAGILLNLLPPCRYRSACCCCSLGSAVWSPWPLDQIPTMELELILPPLLLALQLPWLSGLADRAGAGTAA